LLLITFLNINLLSAEYEDEWDNYIEFDPIVVIATRLPMNISDIPFGVDYIDGYEINPGEELSDVLESEKGVDVLSYGGKGSLKTLSIRGNTSNQSLVMMDGIPMNSSYDGSVDFNLLSSNSVHHIELIRGPVSALYGANALGGVVNIISDPFYRSPERDYYVSFLGGLGSFDKTEFHTTTGVRIKPLTISVTAGGEESEGFRPNSDHNRRELRLNAGIDVAGAGDFRLITSMVDSELGVIGTLTNPDDTARQKDDIRFFGIDHNIDFSPYFTLNTDFSMKRTHRNYTSEQYGHSETDSDLMTYTFGLNGTLNFNGLNINNAFEITDDEVELVSTSIEEDQIWGLRKFAYSLQTSYIADMLSLVGGIRLDHSSQWGNFVSPRVGGSFEIIDGLNIYSSYSRGFRAPTMTELYWPEDPYYGGGGNPDLIPEKSHSFEVGMKLNRDIGSISLNAGTTFFYQTVEDLISGWPPENVDNAKIKGIELSFGMNLPYGFYTSLNHTFQRCENGDSEELYYRPDNKFYTRVGHILNIRPVFITNELELSFTGQRIGWYFDEFFQRQDVDMDSYTLLDYSIGVDVSLFNLEFSIKNLTDEQYQEIADYPMPGREYHFGVGIEFE
jgi:outer membrane receptor for ferrienterochelin and colicins